MQDLLLYRLVGRRDKLAEVFGIEDLLPSSETQTKAPTIRYSLETREDREIAASDLGLAVQVIEDRLRESGLMDEKGHSNHIDTLALKGKLRPCRKTVLLGLLEKTLYPTGLTRRVNRFRHFKRLKSCAYAS